MYEKDNETDKESRKQPNTSKTSRWGVRARARIREKKQFSFAFPSQRITRLNQVQKIRKGKKLKPAILEEKNLRPTSKILKEWKRPKTKVKKS